MPTPDEIIESFKAAAKNETWTKQKDDPQALDRAVDQLRDLLNENDPGAYSQKAYDFMESQKGGPSVGTATCQALFTKGDAGKAAATDVAKRVITAELDRYQVSAGGFIRGQHAINGLTKQFIQDTSPDCERQVREKVEGLAQKYGDLNQIASGTDMRAKTEATSKLGKDMLDVMVNTPLTQESVTFLKEIRDTIESDKGYVAKHMKGRPQDGPEKARLAQSELAEILVNNNAALRFTSPVIRTNPTLGNNELWKDASGASLSTFSGAQKDELKPKMKHSALDEHSKPKKLSKQELAENQHLVDISKNIHEGRGMVLEMQGQLKAGFAGENLTSQQSRESAKLESTLKPKLEKVEAAEKKLAELNKPISVAKIKAFFSAKGVGGAKADLNEEIQNTQKEIDAPRAALNDKFAKLKSDREHQQNKEQLAKKTGLNPDKLESALQIPAVNKAMMTFAKKEFNSENLEFMDAVKQFKAQASNGASVEQLRKSADDIRKTYLEKPDGGFAGSLDNVSKTINLSADVREKLEKSLDKLSQSKPDEQTFKTWGPETRKEMSQAFDEANEQVLKMTENDTFRRFQHDPSYKEAVKESVKPEKVSVGQSLGVDKNAVKVDAPKQTVKMGV